jgi:hypothetical protein
MRALRQISYGRAKNVLILARVIIAIALALTLALIATIR